MTSMLQLRKELLSRAHQLRALIENLSNRIDLPTPTSPEPSSTKSPWTQPVQPLQQPTDQPLDFRLSDFPEAVKKCKQIISILRRHRDASPFNQPVDAKVLNIPDYHTIIKKPMDLGTVAKKLDNYHQHYTMAQDLAEDVRLIWRNCKLYNGQQHRLSQSANELERIFEAKFKAVLDRYGGAGSPIPAAHVSDADVPVKRPKTDTLDRRKDDAPMSYEEKQQLGQLIGSLDGIYSNQVFEMIQTSCPEALDDTSEEVELDIEKLDPATARKLERFVKSVTRGRAT